MNEYVNILVLFDIDGTLLHPSAGARRSMSQSFQDTLKKNISFEPGFFAGKTDILIVTDLLQKEGFSEADISSVRDDILDRYITYLNLYYNAKNDARLYPGVAALIKRLQATPYCHLGLLTGNIETGARIKLGPFELNEAFPVGAYGNDGYLRTELTEIAVQRAEEYYDVEYLPHNVVVIGDTIEDIKCGKIVGAKTIGISQHLKNEQELQTMNPDYVFTGFENSDELVDAIFSRNTIQE